MPASMKFDVKNDSSLTFQPTEAVKAINGKKMSPQGQSVSVAVLVVRLLGDDFGRA